MIRFLQRDNRLTKALFVVIIAAASVSMVVYLIPGLAAGGAVSASDYAVVYPHWYNRLFSNGDEILQTHVEQIARQQIQQRNPQYADNPMIMNYFTQQVGQQLLQQQVMLEEAERLGIAATSDDVVNYLHSGPTGEVIFPNGKFIGDQQYAALVNNRLFAQLFAHALACGQTRVFNIVFSAAASNPCRATAKLSARTSSSRPS